MEKGGALELKENNKEERFKFLKGKKGQNIEETETK